ncbi:hypothetical protein CQ047_16565 [Microbacterium sp. MYb72]|uniref:hypothetical protein n=1 Tax=Microbacterium sp. MYb72 TaxID=1848693 RepID=UPI000CFCF165|nr:hypothetical protein [Microbacterium sp. MYb72]PRB04602.1 hypothetical protein CQ047_16565 [Microbacterium sp. MYb72]
MSDTEDVVMARMESLLKAMRPRVDLTHKRSDELIADISRWRKPDPLRTSLVIKDAPECGWYIQVDSVDPPPAIEHWGMQIAEIAHHLRSILNTTLTRIVLADGGTPSKALQYPIALTAKSWRQQAGRIKGLPERVQRAIYASQPFMWARNTGNLAENHLLAVLAWVDNEDKHRLELQGSLAPSWIEHEARIIDADGVARRVEPKLTYDWSLTPGSRVVDADTTPHVVSEMDKITLDLQMEILYPDELGTTTIVHQLIEEMWSGAQDAIMALAAAWADEAIDYRLLAGSSDFLQGAAFGKAAVDTHAGAGTWDDDFARRRYTQPPKHLDPEEIVIPPEVFDSPTDESDDQRVVWESIKRNLRRGFGAD